MSITDTHTVDGVDPDTIGSPLDPGTLLSPDGLADRWSCSRAFIYKCLADGLPSVKLGRARRIRVGDADAWLAENCGDPIG